MRIITYFLYPVSKVYHLAVICRLFLYKINFFRVKKLSCPVICVGNLTLGGTGKTPLTAYLADFLKEKGRKVVIVSRGYKGTAKNEVNIVSDGKNILLTPEQSGDEPYLLAKKLEDTPILTGVNRFRVGKAAVEKFHPDVIIMDDGFQHLSLARDINILLLNSASPFGNGFLFPRGRLREPVSEMKRADLIVVNGPQKSPTLLPDSQLPFFYAQYQAVGLREINTGKIFPLNLLKGKRGIAFCGIGQPEGFRKSLLDSGMDLINFLTFPDHYAYTTKDLEKIRKENTDNFVLTTEKDAVRLEHFLPLSFELYILEIKLTFLNNNFDQEIIKSLSTQS